MRTNSNLHNTGKLLLAIFGIIFFSGALFTIYKLAGRNFSEKITGVNFIGPAKEIKENSLESVLQIGAEWIAINPYAMEKQGSPFITFDKDWQWWGEKSEGVTATIKFAGSYGLKVLLKPHIWVGHGGFTGTFSLSSEDGWKIWEQQYENYIMSMVTIANNMNVEMFCIGTEFKIAVQQRPKFWFDLIEKIRSKYNGELIYAANWDNYQNIPFWDKLDYVGINAYFPLSEQDTPTIEELVEAWKEPFNKINQFRKEVNKQVIFTEYGYRSIDKAAGEQWKLKESWETDQPANQKVQVNGYKALYQTFWNRDWFKGGFIWKWYDYHDIAGGEKDTDYTPQNKPTEEVIRKWYMGTN